jgi:hypothetical protein
MGGKILGSRITLTMDEEVECFAFHNASDKLDRDLPLYAAVVFLYFMNSMPSFHVA